MEEIERERVEISERFRIPGANNFKVLEKGRSNGYKGYYVPSNGDIFWNGGSSNSLSSSMLIGYRGFASSCIGKIYSRMTPEEQKVFLENDLLVLAEAYSF